MTPEHFVYWLQGFFEITNSQESQLTLTQQQVQIIKDHLKLVFNKQTPTYQPDSNNKTVPYIHDTTTPVLYKTHTVSLFSCPPIMTCSTVPRIGGIGDYYSGLTCSNTIPYSNFITCSNNENSKTQEKP